MRLVLASASPRRADLLRAAGYAFDTCAVDVDERVRAGEPPTDYVRRLAAEKSARALEKFADARGDLVVIGADTTVIVDGETLAKPEDEREARGMLERLSGRPHEVLTGVSVRTGADERGRVEITRVWFASLSPGDILWYVGTGEGRDKAGGYAIQGLASRFIPRIEGSYTNVVGLPISTVSALLDELGVRPTYQETAIDKQGRIGLS
jgi:septum formation protein